MSITFEQFAQDFADLQHAITHEHGNEDGKVDAFCKLMHRDLGLAATKIDNADEIAARHSIDADSLDLTNEHASLHILLRRVVVEGRMVGMAPDQLLAGMFIIGRRFGMQEAARLTASFDVPDTPEVTP